MKALALVLFYYLWELFTRQEKLLRHLRKQWNQYELS